MTRYNRAFWFGLFLLLVSFILGALFSISWAFLFLPFSVALVIISYENGAITARVRWPSIFIMLSILLALLNALNRNIGLDPVVMLLIVLSALTYRQRSY